MISLIWSIKRNILSIDEKRANRKIQNGPFLFKSLSFTYVIDIFYGTLRLYVALIDGALCSSQCMQKFKQIAFFGIAAVNVVVFTHVLLRLAPTFYPCWQYMCPLWYTWSILEQCSYYWRFLRFDYRFSFFFPNQHHSLWLLLLLFCVWNPWTLWCRWLDSVVMRVA